MPKNDHIVLVTGLTGRWLLVKVNRVLDQLAFFWLCVKILLRHRLTGYRLINRVIIQQIYFTAVQSLELIAVLALLIGTFVVVQGFHQLSRIGSQESLSTLLIAILIREMGPLLTAIIVILRSGSAIALEMGYMNVLHEIEGLEMQGIPPLHFLCIPRLVGVAIAVICLIILFDLIAIAGGYFAAWAIENLNIWNFIYNLAGAISISDFLVVVIKGVCFGFIIPTVCLYNGFRAQGAVNDIPPRVSRAMVDCLIYCVVFSLLITLIFSF